MFINVLTAQTRFALGYFSFHTQALPLAGAVEVETLYYLVRSL